jgi:hypothetical protein
MLECFYFACWCKYSFSMEELACVGMLCYFFVLLLPDVMCYCRVRERAWYYSSSAQLLEREEAKSVYAKKKIVKKRE